MGTIFSGVGTVSAGALLDGIFDVFVFVFIFSSASELVLNESVAGIPFADFGLDVIMADSVIGVVFAESVDIVFFINSVVNSFADSIVGFFADPVAGDLFSGSLLPGSVSGSLVDSVPGFVVMTFLANSVAGAFFSDSDSDSTDSLFLTVSLSAGFFVTAASLT